MRTIHRELTYKYKSLRLQPDSLYLSRLLQTLFNKFTKQGKKAKARRQIAQALTRLRYTVRRPRPFNTIIRILQQLRIQFLLIPKRKGKRTLEVPVPIRRNKRETLSVHTLYSAIAKRKERTLSERYEQEMLTLTQSKNQSTTIKQKNSQLRRVYEERVNMEER